MSYIEKIILNAQNDFLKSKLLAFKVDKVDIHPVMAAFLWYRGKQDEKNTASPVLYRLFLQCAYHFILPSKMKELDEIVKSEFDGRRFIALAPDNQLVMDFCHTKVPQDAISDINAFLSETDVYIEFPASAVNAGVFADAVYINGSQNFVFSNSDKKFSAGSNLIKTNSAQYRDNLKNLTDMVILYYLSDNKNTQTDKEFFSQEKYSKLKNLSKLKSKLKTFSIIKKIYLSPPNTVESWRDNTEKKSFELTHAFEVRGHWRWQACGEKHSVRKLIWINPYKKGSGEIIEKIEISQLKKVKSR